MGDGWSQMYTRMLSALVVSSAVWQVKATESHAGHAKGNTRAIRAIRAIRVPGSAPG